MKRQQFLKLTALGSLGAMLPFPVLGSAFSTKELESGNEFDVILVGTGYGSAVTALRLAESGKRCLLLEMGLDWKNSGIKYSGVKWAEKQSTWLRNTTVAPLGNFRWFEKFTGALDKVELGGVNIFEGRGVGGSSIVNGAMAVTPLREYFEEIFPNLNSDDFYNKYFPLANNELGANLIPNDYYQKSAYYGYSRRGEKEAENAGYDIERVPSVYDFEYMQKEEAGEVPKSALGGETLYGSNYGKKDLTKTYLKKALETGNVSIIGLHKVEQIIENLDDSYTLKVSQINTKGNTVATKTYSTGKLFLGAGSRGTTELLLKSQAKGTLNKLDNNVGKYWGNNGNTLAIRSGLKESMGANQSPMLARGAMKWSKNDDAHFAEIAPIGLDIKSALYLVISRVPKYGTFSYNASKEQLELDWGEEQNSHMARNAGTFLDNMNKANGGKRGNLLFLPSGIDEKVCYHPLGGCVLGKATDEYGRLNNYKGLYITDGSLIPASIGVNPFITITAIAEYCIENVIANDFSEQDDNVNTDDGAINVVIYPTPFSNQFTIKLNCKEEEPTIIAEIYNRYGFRIASKKLSNLGNNTYNYSGLWWLTKGVYVLKLKTSRGTISHTIAK